MLRYIIGVSVLAAAIMIVRKLADGKILKKHQYAIWLLIPVYMILSPFISIYVPSVNDINLAMSDRTTVKYVMTDNTAPLVKTEADKTGALTYDTAIADEPDTGAGDHAETTVEEKISEYKQAKDINWNHLIKNTGITVSAVLVTALVIYNAGFIIYCRRNSELVDIDAESGLRIRGIEQKDTPFLLFDTIYVEKGSKDINRFIICHEACHYKHKDYIWIWLRYLVLAINWYNPLIWTAFILSGRDCEMACDEEVLSIMGKDLSKDYARTLFSMMQDKAGSPFSITVSTGINDGYKTMKKRIMSIKNPAKKSYKVLSLSLAVLLAFSSCTFIKPEDTDKVSKNTPWFTSNTYDIKSGANPKKKLAGLSTLEFAGVDDKYYIIHSYGSHTDYSMFDTLNVISRDTKEIVKSINLNSFRKKDADDYISNILYSGGKITVKTKFEEKDLDPSTGSVLDIREERLSNTPVESHFYKVGQYTVETIIIENWDIMERGCDILIKTPGGDVLSNQIKEQGKDIYVYSLIPVNETSALLLAQKDAKKEIYELDIANNKISHADPKDYEWLGISGPQYSIVTGSDGKIYARTADGVFRIDAAKKSFEEVFNFNYCDLNIGTAMNQLELIDCTGDSLTFMGQVKGTYSNYKEPQSDYQIVELSKAKKNPHVGKTRLELYSLFMDEGIGDALKSFNENNKDYFIELTHRYDVYDSNNSEEFNRVESWDDNKLAILNKNSNMSNALITDIVAGKGPDILINADGYGQLNNPDYLADLTPFVNDLSSEEYFTNIIDGAKTDGVLYQLPIGFFIYGIYTDVSKAGSSGIGFTLDEYQQFVSKTLNGSDLIVHGQAVYFSQLFNYMEDRFIANGKADFTGSEFAALADYVRDNAPEKCPTFNEMSWDSNEYADITEIRGIGEFLDRRNWKPRVKDPTILGLPSVDGRGPEYKSYSSVAISAHAKNIDACGEFVKMLLSEGVQEKMGMYDNFVLNRKAFRSVGESTMEFLNNGGNDGTALSGDSRYTSDHIDNIERVIMSCSKKDNENSDISKILIEEMPAYFTGQKDLNAVVNIAQDRVQKVLDERK